MAKKVKPNQIANEITELLTKYSDEITQEMLATVDEVTEGVKNEIDQHITWKDKKYSKAFRTRNVFKDKRNKRNIWYVNPPYYRITHLLEYGHINRDGSRTRAYPHVKFGQEYLEENFYKKMEEVLERCKI